MKTNWQIKKLNEICDKASSNISQNQLNDEAGSYPIYGAGGFIKNISFYYQDKEYISIVKDGAGIGRINLLPAKSSVIGTLQYLIPKEGVGIKFLYYILSSFDFLKYKKGAAIPHVYFREYSEEKFLLPPLPEQQRIVKILDEVFEKIELAKKNIEKNLQNSRDLFESYLNNVFSNPGEDWVEKRLGDFYDVRDGTHDSPKYQKEGCALITSKNLKRGELDYHKIKYISERDYNKINERSRVNKGDILFAMIGTIGNPVVIKVEPDFAIKNVALFKVPKEQNSYFLKYFLDSRFVIDKMISEAKGTTQKFVGLGYLRNFKVKLPKLAKQELIVAKLDKLSEQTKKLEEIYKKKLENLEELKKSILKKAFSGEL